MTVCDWFSDDSVHGRLACTLPKGHEGMHSGPSEDGAIDRNGEWQPTPPNGDPAKETP